VRVAHGDWDPRILVFQVERLVTAFAVITERYVVLIDTLFSPDLVSQMLDTLRERKRGQQQLLAINTHAHWDHAWGNSALVGPDALEPAPIMGHRRGRDLVLSEEARSELARKQTEDPETFAQVRLQPATVLIESETVLDGGDLHLVVLPTPGHEPDHLAVYIPELRAVFTGDAAEWPIPFVSGPANLAAMRSSLQRMLALDPELVLYAHAPGRTDASVLRANQAYFDELERRARAARSVDQSQPQDPEAQLAYPLDSVPGVAQLDAKERAFYRDAHHSAIRAMLAYVGSTRS
jgi:glyoxylase-like metal-dependent hydrolase (beta-lactamase superfamily II)